MLIGYARVSTQEQDTQAQLSALRSAGCGQVYQETASGAKRDRPQLERLMHRLEPGDTLVVWKLDRLARSLPDLLNFVARLEAAEASFRSLTEAIDTSTAAGRMLMHILGAFAEFERAVLSERTRHGLAAARLAGRVGGQPRSLSPAQEAALTDAVSVERISIAEAGRRFGVHRATAARIVARARKEMAPHPERAGANDKRAR